MLDVPHAVARIVDLVALTELKKSEKHPPQNDSDMHVLKDPMLSYGDTGRSSAIRIIRPNEWY